MTIDILDFLINKTPHPVVLLHRDNTPFVTLPACPKEDLIRLSSTTKEVEDHDLPLGFAVPVTKTVFSEPVGLPEYAPDKYYVVSQIVKNALPDRRDLLVPAEVVRDDSGNIVGCYSFGI